MLALADGFGVNNNMRAESLPLRNGLGVCGWILKRTLLFWNKLFRKKCCVRGPFKWKSGEFFIVYLSWALPLSIRIGRIIYLQIALLIGAVKV